MWVNACACEKSKLQAIKRNATERPVVRSRCVRMKENWFSFQISTLVASAVQANTFKPLGRFFLHVWRLSGTGTQHGTAAKAQKKCWPIVIFHPSLQNHPLCVCPCLSLRACVSEFSCGKTKYEQLKREPENAYTPPTTKTRRLAANTTRIKVIIKCCENYK